MSATELTVIIVAYKNDFALRECLTSLAEQDNARHKVIVADNALSSETRDAVAASHPNASYIQLDKNVGFGAACNAAVGRSTSAYVLFLNPDTYVPAGGLTMAVSALERRPDVAILGCRLVKENGELDHACKRAIPSPMQALLYFLRLRRFAALRQLVGDYTLAERSEFLEDEVPAVNGAFMLMRRDVFNTLQGFDERFWMYGEDLDLCVRSRAIGRVVYWPGLTVRHTKAGTTGSRRPMRVNIAFHRAMWLFYRKHGNYVARTPLSYVVWSGIHIRMAASIVANSIARARVRRQLARVGER